MLYSYEMVTGFEPQKWTTGAILCYKRGCNCQGCFINKTYRETLGNGRCCMKLVVRQLVLKQGLPNNISFELDIREG